MLATLLGPAARELPRPPAHGRPPPDRHPPRRLTDDGHPRPARHRRPAGTAGEPTRDADARRRLLAALVAERAVVHGEVTLSSGATADYYVDLRRVTLDGEVAPLIGEVMLDLVADLEVDAVGGLTLGADPVATAMLHTAAARGRRLDAFVVRKAGKAHGLQRRIEGPDVAGPARRWPSRTPRPPAARCSPPSRRCARPAPTSWPSP